MLPQGHNDVYRIQSATHQCHSYDAIDVAAPPRAPVLLSSAASIGPRLRRQRMKKTAFGIHRRLQIRAISSLPRLRYDDDSASSIL